MGSSMSRSGDSEEVVGTAVQGLLDSGISGSVIVEAIHRFLASSTSGPMEEEWKREIQLILDSDTSCTGQDEYTVVPEYEHVRIVRQGTHIYVAKTLKKEEAAAEAKILRTLPRHPAINVLLDVVPGETPDKRVLHLEYCKNGSLFAYLQRKPDPVDISPNLLLWLDQLLTALVHMHENGVVHCDIKAENIFVKSWEQLVVGDFGHAKFSDKDGKCNKGNDGTPRFLPPEQWNELVEKRMPPNHSDLSDVWGLGCVLHELMHGLLYRWKCVSMVEYVTKGMLNEPDNVPVKPEHARARRIATEVRAQALTLDPQHRPHARALLDKLHSFTELRAQESPVKKQKTDIERPAAR